MNTFLERRFIMENLNKWMDSELPMSVHTANGWIDQLKRMERYKERVYKANNEEESLDFLYAFFQNCYHLREWIPTFEKIEDNLWQEIWKSFLSKNECMRLCRDICNITKHLSIHNPSTTSDIIITRKFLDDGTEFGKFLGWNLSVRNKNYDLFNLMEDCSEAWKIFIKNELFEILELDKFFDKK